LLKVVGEGEDGAGLFEFLGGFVGLGEFVLNALGNGSFVV
jgi:hypothetical protein